MTSSSVTTRRHTKNMEEKKQHVIEIPSLEKILTSPEERGLFFGFAMLNAWSLTKPEPLACKLVNGGLCDELLLLQILVLPKWYSPPAARRRAQRRNPWWDGILPCVALKNFKFTYKKYINEMGCTYHFFMSCIQMSMIWHVIAAFLNWAYSEIKFMFALW